METVDLIIESGTLLTLDAERRILKDGSLAIAGDRIRAVGKTPEVRSRYRAHRTLDASRHLVMPGLVNGHAHLVEIARGLIPDTLRTSDWLKYGCYLAPRLLARAQVAPQSRWPIV